MKIEIIKGDITKQKVDVIVNAANNHLMGGGGVDGAIHTAAGPQLSKECRKIGWCDTGQARFTNAYNLPVKWIVHTAGPVWLGGHRKERELLADCYRNSLKLADNLKAKTVAFPSISTGAYMFPIEEAAGIAHEAVKTVKCENVEKIVFVCFEQDDYEVHKKYV